MPDGDVVHSHLGRFYQKPYKILCEGVASSEDCARAILKKLRLDLRETAKWPLLLSRNIADLFSQVIGPLAFSNDVEAAKISRQIDELTRRVGGSLRGKELMTRASKSLLNDLRHGQEINGRNPQALILKRYIREVYEADFKELIPLSKEHYAGVSHGELQRRIEAMEPYLDQGFHQFAQDAIKSQKLDNLRLPQRKFRRGIDLDENLLTSQVK
jgi:hypothetical protein